MNEEKIIEALKIIKEPITVNSVNYKYFDEINYDKLIMVYDNCLWFANNLEQIFSTAKQLEKEKQELINYCKFQIKKEKEKFPNPLESDKWLKGRISVFEEILTIVEKR